MNKRARRFRKLVTILAFTGVTGLVVTFFPMPGIAQDDDFDGFSNSEETSGWLTPLYTNTPYPVSATRPDLFVILLKAPQSKVPNDALALMSLPKDQGGLDIAVHITEVLAAVPDRAVTSNQKAASLTESLATTTAFLGWCSQGTLNDDDDCVVYTQKILDRITGICTNNRYGTANCVGPNGEQGNALLNLYIKWAMVHELGHTMTLAAKYNNKIGYHYATGTGEIMDQSVYYTDKQGKVTFYIPAKYCGESQAAFDLSVDTHYPQ